MTDNRDRKIETSEILTPLRVSRKLFVWIAVTLCFAELALSRRITLQHRLQLPIDLSKLVRT